MAERLSVEEHHWEYLSEDNYEFGNVLIPVRVECLCGRVLEGWELDHGAVLPCECGRKYRLLVTMEVMGIEGD